MATKATAKKAAPKAKPATASLGSCMPARTTAQQKAQERKWQAQDDLRTLQRAVEVKSDSSRVKAAQAEATAQMKALQTVTKK